MVRKRVITSFLLLVSILMLAIPVMPHHHHTNGLMCMKNDISTDCCERSHTNLDEEACSMTLNASAHHHCCCNTHCAAAHFITHTPQDNDCDFRPDYLWVSTLYYEPVFQLLLLPEEKEQKHFSYYLESLHGIRIATSIGLRAPPAALA